MAEFVYTPQPSSIPKFLTTIRGSGVPDKVTLKTIESFGFKSKNDRNLLPILKGLGLVDNSGVPTDRWRAFRSKQTGGVALADGIRGHYSRLFALYPDAYQKDTEALHSFFSSHTNLSDNTLKLVIATFRALCALADFEAESVTSPVPAQGTSPRGEVGVATAVVTANPGYTININIQLTLPENADTKTFEEFFKAMRKNLLDEK